MGTVLFAKFEFWEVQFNDLQMYNTNTPRPADEFACPTRAPHLDACTYNVLHCDVTEYNQYFTDGAPLPRSHCFCTSPHWGRLFDINVQSKNRPRQVPLSGPHFDRRCTLLYGLFASSVVR